MNNDELMYWMRPTRRIVAGRVQFAAPQWVCVTCQGRIFWIVESRLRTKEQYETQPAIPWQPQRTRGLR
jgi:hypothetical protein